MQANKVLEVRDLDTAFRLNKQEFSVLHGLSFDVYENETLCVVGESGCGKSVMLLSLMKLLPENGRIKKGSVKLGGMELSNLSDKDMNQVRGRQIGMIFQEPMTCLNPLLTIGRQMTEGLMLHLKMSRAQARITAIEYLNRVGVSNPNIYPA